MACHQQNGNLIYIIEESLRPEPSGLFPDTGKNLEDFLSLSLSLSVYQNLSNYRLSQLWMLKAKFKHTVSLEFVLIILMPSTVACPSVCFQMRGGNVLCTGMHSKISCLFHINFTHACERGSLPAPSSMQRKCCFPFLVVPSVQTPQLIGLE